MADWKDRLKGFFEWLEHGKTVAELLIAFGGGALVRAVLHRFTQIPNEWITPIWLLSAGLVMLLLVWIGQKIGHPGQQGTSLVQTGSPKGLTAPPPGVWDYQDFFRTAYISPMQAEVEQRMSTTANAAQPNDREAFLLKVIGIGSIAYTYDTVWWSIYGSQLMFLLELNRRQGMLPASKAREYYDKAKSEFPEAYAAYSFDNWATFMVNNILIVRHASDMIEITQRGKDFLKFLLHWGKEASLKKL
ncbi:MAG TPA: hypothetical protein VFF64_22335 [Candidatus Eremiobacteraceae bacterium]|nr:hypothetical protein [Candidatus Eremiobacteraceae bacterium]